MNLKKSDLLKRGLGLACLGLAVLAPAAASRADALQSLRIVEAASQQGTLQDLASRDPALDSRLRALAAEAQDKGSVKVVVKLAVAFAPASLLGEGEQALQRRDIGEAALALRSALPQARSFQLLDGLPYVALELDAQGLGQLVTLPGLSRITTPDALNWQRDMVELRSRTDEQAAAPSDLGAVSPQVFGGTDADPASHPFQVGLLAAGIADNKAAYFCGGSLIADRYVVTTASCSAFDPASVQVLAGTQRLDGSGQLFAVNRITRHPSYNGRDFNVAVWELAAPVTGIPFATLATALPAAAGTPLQVTGWGATRFPPVGSAYPVMLQQLDMAYVPTVDGRCGSFGAITPQMLCAGGVAGQSICVKDAGSPLTVDRGAGVTNLVGIADGSLTSSPTPGCAQQGSLAKFTSVAAPAISSFILSMLPPDPGKKIGFAETSVSVDESGKVQAAKGKDWRPALSQAVRAGQVARLTVVRPSADGSAKVSYSTAAGTAGQMPNPPPAVFANDPASGRYDFLATSGTITFKPGQTTAEIDVPIIDDPRKEGPETFTVNLSNPAAGWWTGDTGTATVTIIDND